MLNKVMLIGRLGRDPEIRYTQSGNAVASFSIATSEYWRDKQGQRQEKTEWHDIVAWDRLADQAQSYLKKGSMVYIEGKLQTRSWDDQQGQKKYRTEVVANQMRFLDSREGTERSGGSVDDGPAVYGNEYPSGGPSDNRRNPSSNSSNNDFNQGNNAPYVEDDVPFVRSDVAFDPNYQTLSVLKGVAPNTLTGVWE
jgi:single-strand DNA-binding protein